MAFGRDFVKGFNKNLPKGVQIGADTARERLKAQLKKQERQDIREEDRADEAKRVTGIVSRKYGDILSQDDIIAGANDGLTSEDFEEIAGIEFTKQQRQKKLLNAARREESKIRTQEAVDDFVDPRFLDQQNSLLANESAQLALDAQNFAADVRAREEAGRTAPTIEQRGAAADAFSDTGDAFESFFVSPRGGTGKKSIRKGVGNFLSSSLKFGGPIRGLIDAFGDASKEVTFEDADALARVAKIRGVNTLQDTVKIINKDGLTEQELRGFMEISGRSRKEALKLFNKTEKNVLKGGSQSGVKF